MPDLVLPTTDPVDDVWGSTMNDALTDLDDTANTLGATWIADGTIYIRGQVVTVTGVWGGVWRCSTTHVSGATFDPTDWHYITGNGTGTVAQRDALTGVPVGYKYLATDDNGHRVSEWDGAAWQPHGAATGEASTYVNDTIGNRPNAATFGIGFYFANDDNGGTLYRSDGATWDKITNGLNWASGTQLAYGEDASLSFSAMGVGNTETDLSALLKVTIPASAVPVKISGAAFLWSATGTASVAANMTTHLRLTDSANAFLDYDTLTIVQVTAANVAHYGMLRVAVVLPAPVASGTYKLRTKLTSAAPANWTRADIVSGTIWPLAWIQAVAQ